MKIKLVIVIIFSFLLINTSREGIVPTIEQNKIIPASNFEEWKSPNTVSLSSTEEKLLNDLKSRYDYQELLALFNSMKAYLSSKFGVYINDIQLVDVEIGDRVWNSQYLTATFKTSEGVTFIVQGKKNIGFRYSHWMMMYHGNEVAVEKITPVEGVPEMADVISSKDDWTLSMECYVKDAKLFLSEQLGIDTDEIELIEHKIGRPKDWYGSARLSVWTFKTKNGEIYTVTQIKSCLGDWSDFKIVNKKESEAHKTEPTHQKPSSQNLLQQICDISYEYNYTYYSPIDIDKYEITTISVDDPSKIQLSEKTDYEYWKKFGAGWVIIDGKEIYVTVEQLRALRDGKSIKVAYVPNAFGMGYYGVVKISDSKFWIAVAGYRID